MLRSIKNHIYRLYYTKIKRDSFKTTYYKWVDIDGDNTLMHHFDLNEKSLVIDAGGYLGDFTSKISLKFNCSTIIFEPLPEYYSKLKMRFENNNKINILEFALSNKTGTANISLRKNSSSLYSANKQDKFRRINLLSVIDFFSDYNINQIDLLKLNVEGAEYDIIEAIIKNNLTSNIKYLLVQFHNFVDNAENKRATIHKHLCKTHKPLWDYPFIWECWERIK